MQQSSRNNCCCKARMWAEAAYLGEHLCFLQSQAHVPTAWPMAAQTPARPPQTTRSNLDVLRFGADILRGLLKYDP
jgi:hypothetical protein